LDKSPIEDEHEHEHEHEEEEEHEHEHEEEFRSILLHRRLGRLSPLQPSYESGQNTEVRKSANPQIDTPIFYADQQPQNM
jgi:hypothetical protein